MSRPEVEAILSHVSFCNVLAIVSCTSCLDSCSEVGWFDLGLGIEDVLESPSTLTLKRTSAGAAARRTAEYASHRSFGAA